MKFFLILGILPIIVSSIYVDPKCTFGESYWCSNLKNAKQCHAVNHCKTTIWQNQVLQPDNEEVCQFCKAIIADVAIYLKENQSEVFISSFLKSACDLVPNDNLATDCKNLINEYLPEILDIIGLDLDPQAICSLLGLCNKGRSFDDTVDHASTSIISKTNGTLCNDCIQFNTDLKKILFGKETQAKLIDFLDAYACSWQGPLKNDCEKFINDKLPKYMDMIAAKYNPKVCCAMFCSGDESAISQQMAAIFNNIQMHKLSVSNNLVNTDKCTACMIIIGELQSLDQNKQIQKLIGDNIKNNICTMFKNYTDQCKNMVDMYLPIFFQFLTSELDPSARCRNFGFCPSQESNRLPMIDLKPSQNLPHRHMVDNLAVKSKASPQCIICEYVMSQVKKLIGDNATEDQIISALDKVCNILPTTIEKECVSFIDLYGKAILDLLMQDLSAEIICTALGLCIGKTNKLTFEPHTKADTCEICQITMQYLESLMEEQSSLDEIKNLVEKICNFLPETQIQQCEKMISDYEPIIIDYLINKFTPKEICQEIGLCFALDKGWIEITSPTTGTPPVSNKKLYYKCVAGPSYWCASRQNAVLCQAEEHCKKYIW